MKVHIENKVLEFENKNDEIDNIFKEINKIINNSSKILSHMLIDEIEIYENYHEYFLDNIRLIEKVEVITLSYKELVEDILVSTFDYVSTAPEKIEELSNEFYKSSDQEDWNQLNNLLGAIGWIMDTFNTIDQDKRLKDVVSSYEDWNLYAKEVFALQEILYDFEEALENQDNITIGDILSYEIIPIFNDMEERLIKLLNMEVIK